MILDNLKDLFVSIKDIFSPAKFSPTKSVFPPTKNISSPTDDLFLDWRFEIPESKKQAIIQQLKNYRSYTDSQLEMILSEEPNTCVIAGAGSGKSTSLIARVYVLNRHLGVDLENITVISFTRKSVEEFREKLRDIYKKLDNVDLGDDILRKVVRTFHSKVLDFAKSSTSKRTRFFEFLEDNNRKLQKTDNGNKSTSEPEFKLELGPKQKEILETVYKNLFYKNEEFRDLIEKLYKAYLERHELSKTMGSYQDKLIASFEFNERSYTSAIHDLLDFPDKKLGQIEIGLDRIKVYYNGYVKDFDLFIFFIPDRETLDRLNLSEGQKEKLMNHLKTKESILFRYADKIGYKILQNQRDADLLSERIRLMDDLRQKTAYKFDYALKGDITEDAVFIKFYEAMEFVENLGLRVGDLSSYIDEAEMDEEDKWFSKALIIFDKEFQNYLEEKNLARFHSLFKEFSEQNLENFKKAEDVLSSMQHILIDEFQDISPEQVYWVRGVLKYLKDKGIKTSLMCVGDDWQSIYGWRGSSPEFFINYNNHFRSKRVKTVKMEENFRSVQEIIDRAELLLKQVKEKTNKHGISMVPYSTYEHVPEPYFITQQTLDCAQIETVINEILQNKKPEEKVFVLSRTNNLLTYFNKHKEIEKLTFHKSKGLEADYCILLGDCSYSYTNDFKNLCYRIAGYKHSYDFSQKEESLRLAYVAITRAKKRCYWFAVPHPGGAFRLVKQET